MGLCSGLANGARIRRALEEAIKIGSRPANQRRGLEGESNLARARLAVHFRVGAVGESMGSRGLSERRGRLQCCPNLRDVTPKL